MAASTRQKQRSRGNRKNAKDRNALETIAEEAPRRWRSDRALKKAGFSPVRGDAVEAIGDARKRRLSRQMRALREQAGMTQAQVAEHMGTSASVVSRLESDAPGNITVDTLERFARAVGAKLRLELSGVR